MKQGERLDEACLVTSSAPRPGACCSKRPLQAEDQFGDLGAQLHTNLRVEDQRRVETGFDRISCMSPVDQVDTLRCVSPLSLNPAILTQAQLAAISLSCLDTNNAGSRCRRFQRIGNNCLCHTQAGKNYGSSRLTSRKWASMQSAHLLQL